MYRDVLILRLARFCVTILMAISFAFFVVASADAAATLLKKDSKGTEVLEMQTKLKELGYYTGELTGSFGAKTEEAVRKFQKKQGLDADGVAGEKTLALLYGEETSGSSGSSSSASSGSLLKEGSKGSAVTSLQTSLKSMGYYKGEITGNYGPKTAEAVKKFQKANGLENDGVAGAKTLALLNGSGSSGSGDASGSTGSTGSTGSSLSSSQVKSLQTSLKSMGFYNGDITGNYGEKTQEAVRKFQKANGLDADGVAGSKTMAALSASGGISGAGSVNAGKVQYVNWYTMRNSYKAGTVVTVYDFSTGLSWKCKFTTCDKHADGEPLTSKDTDIMYNAFGKKNTWTPKAVWFTMPDGKTYIGSIHNMAHGTDKIAGNNFAGILCMHFPRDMKEAEKTGDYAVQHQRAITAGWEKTQSMM